MAAGAIRYDNEICHWRPWRAGPGEQRGHDGAARNDEEARRCPTGARDEAGCATGGWAAGGRRRAGADRSGVIRCGSVFPAPESAEWDSR